MPKGRARKARILDEEVPEWHVRQRTRSTLDKLRQQRRLRAIGHVPLAQPAALPWSAGEWPLPPELTFYLIENFMLVRGGWKALASVCQATKEVDDRAKKAR